MASRNLIQTWVASGVLLNMVALGMVLSFPTCLMPALASPGDIQTDLETATWIASVFGLAFSPGNVVSWLLMDWRGRRFAHAAVMIPGILGWLLIYFAPNVSCLMIGRILGGFSAGSTVNLGAVVISEYTSPQLRGVFLTLKAGAISIGNIILHILGHLFYWRKVALYGFAVNLAAFFIVLTWPESPAWLARKKSVEVSAKSFFFLRGNNEQSRNEFDNLIKAQTNDKTSHEKFSMKVFAKRFLGKDFRKPFLIAVMAGILLESSGRHFFPAYAMQIIEEVLQGKSLYVVVGIDGLALLGASLAALLARSVRRRVLLLSSAASALLVLTIFCFYHLLSAYSYITQSTYVSIGLLIVYFILTNIGCSPIPIVLFGEIFPLAHRGPGLALVSIIMSLYMMLVLKIVPFLMTSLKVYGMFAVFGVVMAGTAIVLYFILPETKDRTLQEIEDYFKNGYFLEDARTEKEKMIST